MSEVRVIVPSDPLGTYVLRSDGVVYRVIEFIAHTPPSVRYEATDIKVPESNQRVSAETEVSDTRAGK